MPRSRQFFQDAANNFFGLVNIFSGGALERFSIFALGIMPYISSSIILQLLTVVVPFLERLSKEGEAGRRKITQYTRYGTVILSLVQSLFISMGLEQIQSPTGALGRPQPRMELPADDDDHAELRHGLPHVARRADHRARHRQRHLAHHLRRHRGGLLPRRRARPCSS